MRKLTRSTAVKFPKRLVRFSAKIVSARSASTGPGAGGCPSAIFCLFLPSDQVDESLFHARLDGAHAAPGYPLSGQGLFNFLPAQFEVVHKGMQHRSIGLHLQNTRQTGYDLASRLELRGFELQQSAGDHLLDP